MRQIPGFFKIVASMMWLAAPVWAEPAAGPSPMERSRQMRREIQGTISGGDVRQLVHFSQRQHPGGESRRVIQAPALRGDASTRGQAAASMLGVEKSRVVGSRSSGVAWSVEPGAFGDFSRQVCSEDGWTSCRGSLQESTWVTGTGGYFYTRRQVYRPVVLVVRDADPWMHCGPRYPRVIFVHRTCPPPTVVVCPTPRPSGFSLFLQF